MAEAIFPNSSLSLLWKVFLGKVVQRVAYEKSNSRMAKTWKSIKISILPMMIGTARAIPQHSKMSPDRLLKSLLVETSSMLPKSVFSRNSDMILVSTVGLCRASITVPLNEQGMVVEGEIIQIASKECFTSINHSFDGSTLGKLLLCAFHAVNVSRYCHNPQIQ